MLLFKKAYRDELLQLALMLSLLRVNQNNFFDYELYNNVSYLDFDNGTSWRSLSPSTLRSHLSHPKSLDSVLLNYERELFADLNSLGRYHRSEYRHPDVHAYLLNIERGAPIANAVESLPEVAPPENQNANINITTNESTDNSAEPIQQGLELTQEDMDLIEVLWKQDVDLGFSIEQAKAEKSDLENGSSSNLRIKNDDDLEKLKTLKAINSETIKEEPKKEEPDENPWAGLDYTIDTETGECIIKEEQSDGLSGGDCDPSCDLPLPDLPLSEILLDEAFRLVELDEEDNGASSSDDHLNVRELENLSLNASRRDSSNEQEDNENDLDFLAEMIQTPQFHHPHHRAAFQSRMPFVRTVSMEQRWQDLANLLSLPNPGDGSIHHHAFSHHHHHAALHNYTHPHAHGIAGYGPDAARGVLLHNATLNPPMGDLNSTVPAYGNLGGTNLGNAVATSMNLTNSSEPMGDSTAAPHYKLEPTHDMMYYQNSSSELNQTDGFLSSILNDEDLQLMDMAMNEGMYTMRMLDNSTSNNATSVSGGNINMTASTSNGISPPRTEIDRMDTSSDSAVSSMGSERVPSLSDGEWCDAGSDSGHTVNDHYVTDYQSKFRPYDYSYSSRHLTGSDSQRIPPVAQKKHQMYGKRYFQDQGNTSSASHPAHPPVKYEYRDVSYATPNSSLSDGAKASEMKYSCSVEFGRQHHLPRNPIEHVQHNHTYHLPAESSGAVQRPVSRDKTAKSRKSEEEHLSRDEKRARALNVPITVDDIINLPMDEFNERLSKYDLSEAQLSLIRDIRRRGKNKVAAQNCRKRKLDQILSLADEVKDMRDRKIRLMNDHKYSLAECKRMKDKYQQLYRHVFQNLRDPDGNQYSPYQYSLQTSADGSILMVPRSNTTSIQNPDRKEPPQAQKD
ncbi:unnamed protein product [Brassicogethes aeneus]|uniref:BZIP domain-containing protein n=1 Tax=Brassicogethes aeneus TaxID=1431903 RepID=A0A9P0BF12_BRAAE|nr:unnamed protein product [Brassicogethes aeneus]